MQYPTRKQKIFLALALYIAVVFLSVNIHILKRDALRFHPRDYNYYAEQAARLTDPGLAKSFAMHIEGYNFLGLQGVEGVISLYHAIHAEYFRYLYVALYAIFRHPLALYIFYSLVFFLPIAYFALLSHPHNRRHVIILLLFSLLYLAFPATLNSATADLRSRVLFAPAWCLVILSVYYERPFWEKTLFFLLLVGIREEGIILGGIVIVLNHMLMKGKPGQWLQTITFLMIDIGALVMFLAFMRWGGFTRVDAAYNPLNFLRSLPPAYWVIILALVVLVGLLILYVVRKRPSSYRLIVVLGVYTLGILLSGFQWLRDMLRWYQTQSQVSPPGFGDILVSATTNEMTALVFYMLIMLGVILWEMSGAISRRLLVALFSALILISTIISLSYYPPLIREWRENVPPARLVWDFAHTHDRYTTQVLLDYDTYQAFYNYDQMIVYNRLPVWDALPEKRYYPENKDALVRQIQKGLDYAVISRASLENVLELAQLAEVSADVIASNERYVILELR